ncbi:hypothetical protein M5K25_017942 [Dendrobium thyrsiflorum]|uniref:DCD domain-containing protein n=1 Tax=Dendrobium thyrsiflorum TaxID=117978 RepID=A0ABD0UHC3_DENTH
MGAGRKTHTVNVDIRIPTSESGHISARNLRKNDLGGVIFGCKHTTMQECLSKQLFGLPAAHFAYVRNIGPGLPIFHFNYSDRKLHGIYESVSHGQMYIDAYAWSEGGAERTAFPAQVRIRIREQCKPLAENEFKDIIEDNYYTPQHFWFELDHSQTRCLIALFKPRPSTLVQVLNPFSQANAFPPSPVPKWKSVKDVKPTSSWNENKFAILSLDSRDSDYGYPTNASSNATEDIDSKELASNLEDLFEGHILDGTSSSIDANFNEAPNNLDKQPVDEEDYKNVLLKLERLSANFKVNSARGAINESTSACVPEDLYNRNKQLLHDSCNSSEKNELLNAGNLHDDNVKTNVPLLDSSMKEEHQVAVNCSDGNANRDNDKVSNESCSLVTPATDSTSANLSHGTTELMEAIRELKERTATLEKQQAESDAEIQHLRNLHRNLGQIIQLLTARFNAIESNIGTSWLPDRLDKVADQYLPSEDLIYLIGGYSGTAWLSALDSFSPSLDTLTPLKSMSYARSYASVVALNGVIYALGGGDGSSWYDTVERYDRRHDEWTACPAMIHKKGSLASATLNGKIYAIGGGDGSESFSDVEMFDPALGRWISWQSMLHRAKSGRLEIFRASSGRLKIFRARSGRLEIATFVFPSGRSVPEVDTAQYRNSVPLGTGTRYNWVPSWYRGVPSGYRAVPSGYLGIPSGTERIPRDTEWIPSSTEGYRAVPSGRTPPGGSAPLDPRHISKFCHGSLQNLTIIGRMILVKSIFLALPLVLSTHTLVPLSLLKEFDKMCRNYIWNNHNGSHGLHYVAWEVLCKMKKMGGRGLHSAVSKMGPLRAKFAWKLIDKPDTLLKRNLIAKFGHYWWHSEVKGSSSVSWKLIPDDWKSLSKVVRWKIASGSSVNVLKDVWILDKSIDKWPTYIADLSDDTMSLDAFIMNGDRSFECMGVSSSSFQFLSGLHIGIGERFAPAAAELNGVLYAVGGYDGHNYLK